MGKTGQGQDNAEVVNLFILQGKLPYENKTRAIKDRSSKMYCMQSVHDGMRNKTPWYPWNARSPSFPN
jgi:hypothetical protein